MGKYFSKVHAGFSSVDTEKVRDQFSFIDKDGDGIYSKEEVLQFTNGNSSLKSHPPNRKNRISNCITENERIKSSKSSISQRANKKSSISQRASKQSSISQRKRASSASA